LVAGWKEGSYGHERERRRYSSVRKEGTQK
jgi:hypothetical protein